MTPGVVERFDALAAELTRAFESSAGVEWPEAEFDAWALRVFAFQFEANPVYRSFCLARGSAPDRVTSWREVPLVPTSAFKALDLANGPLEAEFRTSGTSGGAARRGRHGVRSLRLYRAASVPVLRRHLLPDLERIRILSLVPSASEADDSSLSRMVAFALDDLGAEGSGTFMSIGAGLDVAGLDQALGEAEASATPVWIVATAFALVHWLDAVADGRARRRGLPMGSRIMETGGFKGRSREVPKEVLYREARGVLGIPPQWIVNEYGMTELLSQFYDAVAGDPGALPPSERRHRPPPSMRTRVLDPTTLAPVPAGSPGLLAHFDLANLGSVSAVLTQDQGVADEDGAFRVLGRMPGAEPRGCSLALDDLLASRASP